MPPAANSIYALIGALVVAGASLLAMVIKMRFDQRVEKEKHAFELESLNVQFSAKRIDVVWEQKFYALSEFLDGTLQIYRRISNARRQRSMKKIDDSEYISALRQPLPSDCQVTLEKIRLLASKNTAEIATELWKCLRDGDIPQGRTLSGSEWTAWKTQFWDIRDHFVEASHYELAYDPSKPKH